MLRLLYLLHHILLSFVPKGFIFATMLICVSFVCLFTDKHAPVSGALLFLGIRPQAAVMEGYGGFGRPQ